MDLEQLIAALNGHADRAALIEAIKRNAKPVFQAIFDEGHGVGLAKANARVAQLEAEKKSADDAAAAAKGKVAEYEREKPDLAKLREGYEAQIAELKAKNTADKKAHREEMTRKDLARDYAELKALLVGADFRVDADYADVLVAKPDVQSRIRYAQDGVREVLQPGRDIPIAVASGEDPMRELAKALVEKVEKKWIVSGAAGGAGVKNGAAAPSKGDVFERVRAQVKRELETRPSQTGDRSRILAERLGVSAPATR